MVVVRAPARWFAHGPIILLRQPCFNCRFGLNNYHLEDLGKTHND